MMSWNGSRGIVAGIMLGLVSAAGCNNSPAPPAGATVAGSSSATTVATPATGSTSAPASTATAAAADVKAARVRLDSLGSRVKYASKDGDLLTEISIEDGSPLTADDVALFGKLTDLESLKILNFRTLDDDLAKKLSGLKDWSRLPD